MTEDAIPVHLPYPGEIGIGAGKLYTPIPERGEDPAGHFHSIVWFPSYAMADALEFVEGTDWVVREGVAF